MTSLKTKSMLFILRPNIFFLTPTLVKTLKEAFGIIPKPSSIGDKLMTGSCNLEIEDKCTLYLIEQVAPKISPLLKFTMNFDLKTVKNQSIQYNSSLKVDILNQTYGILEPLLENFSCKVNYNKVDKVSDLGSHFWHNLNLIIPNILVNVKPSIVACIQDILNRIFSEKYGMRVENCSRLKIKNNTGFPMNCYLTNEDRLVQPGDETELNIVIENLRVGLDGTGSPFGKGKSNSEELASRIKNFWGIKKILKFLMKDLTQEVNESTYELKPEIKEAINLSNMRKEVRISIPALGINQIVNFEEVSENFYAVADSLPSNGPIDEGISSPTDAAGGKPDDADFQKQFLISNVSLQGANTMLTLNSNYFLRNNLDSPILFCLYKKESDDAGESPAPVPEKPNPMQSDLPAKKSNRFLRSESMDEICVPAEKNRKEDSVMLHSSIQLNKFVEKYTKPTLPKKKLIGDQIFEIRERKLAPVRFLKSIYLEPGKNCQLDLYKNFPTNYYFKIFLPNSS